ncbi:hypothetical protein EHM76_00365 [bacterium]|nr:MAG: hypothetical protein EHM76_00365 [bacterium]
MEMLLVNPRKRRKKARGQKRRSSRRRRRRSGGARRAAAGYTVGSAPVRRRKLNPRRRRRGRGRRRAARRRNPISLRSFGPGNLMSQVSGALPGAVGALGLDVALGFLPIPVTWKAGIPGYLTKIVGAIALGMAASKVAGASTGAKVTTGALTVMFHGVLRELLAANFPTVPLGMYLRPGVSGLGYAGSGYNPMNGMGMYLPDISADNMGMDQRDLGMYMAQDGQADFYNT